MPLCGSRDFNQHITKDVLCDLTILDMMVILQFHTGIIHMDVWDEVRVEGRLHSNGEAGAGSSAGGGAGGSIQIRVGHLDGAGSIETVGGNGM